MTAAARDDRAVHQTGRLQVVPFDGDLAHWDRFVGAAADSTFCHLAGWRAIMDDGSAVLATPGGSMQDSRMRERLDASISSSWFLRHAWRLSIYAGIALAGRSGDVARNPSEPVVAECKQPKPGWIWCDDFEEDRLGRYFEYVNSEGRFVRARGAGLSGSFGMSARYPATSPSAAGQLHLAFGRTPSSYFKAVDAGTANYRELYWRLYVLHPARWVGESPDKLSRAISFAGDNWAQAMIAHVWNGGQPQLVIDPASGTDPAGTLTTTRYNDSDHLRWLGAAAGTSNMFDAAHLGRWVCVESHIRLNDPDASNGLFELWVDGNSEASRTGLNWVGAFSAYGINALFIENYRNDASPVEQSRYLDNVVVSTRRIGC